MQSGVPTRTFSMPEKPMSINRISAGGIVGVDVSKEWLDLSVAGEAGCERIGNNEDEIAAFLQRRRPSLVAFEPTGGYERVLREALRARGILFTRVHPNDVIAFRKARGIKAKTDPIDARLIADFAAEASARRGLRPAICGDETLRELAARRRQIAQTLQAERCRLAMATTPAVRASLQRVIDTLIASRDEIEGEIEAHIAADTETARLAALLQGIRGIGPVTAMTLIADMPELGLLSSKEIAALAGLAPVTRQSGKSSWRARTTHGRSAIRTALFNAARAAIAHPSPFRDFYDRLVIENRRPGKVALTAVMRKILVTANAVARDRQPWKAQTT